VTASSSFHDLGLDPRIVGALRRAGFDAPLPVQSAAIPPALAGRDVVASAQTGSGKTLAYLAPLSSLLLTGPRRSGVRVLVLVPTRELALQVAEVAETLRGATRLSCAAVYGGVGYGEQSKAFRRGVPVVVATPGRLLDHMKRGNCQLHHVGALVLDEADRMLEMGFVEDVRRIAAETPADRQTLLFSATIDARVEALAKDLLRDPVRVRAVSAGDTDSTALPSGLRHHATIVRAPLKLPLLVHLLHDPTWETVLVFARTRHRCEALAQALVAAGVSASALHSERSQAEREEALARFRRGELQALVATDVAERGLDIPRVTHVVNFDLPGATGTYLHRVGRTARVGGEGTAMTLAAPAEEVRLRRDARTLGFEVDIAPVAGFDYDQRPPPSDALAEPRGRGRGGRRRDSDHGADAAAPATPDDPRAAFWAKVRARRGARGGARRR
jgi:ATP-dependent RNA helicase RhlE